MNTALATPDGTSRIAGRYALHGELASGGMATVYLGRLVGSAGFSRPVAIKRLHGQYARDPEFVAMFLDEARLAARVRHPNVVPTLDVVAEGGEVFLVMEYVHGEALSRLLAKTQGAGERVPLDVAVAVTVGMLEGLHAAHEAKSERGSPLGIVHRDVSPQNVLVGADGIARVFDFGVAKAADRMHSTKEGTIKGKMAYMSPEQINMQDVDRRTDVWASGVVLWETLAGRRLFVADSAMSLIHDVLNAEIARPSSFRDVPPALDEAVMRALARDRDGRFASAHEMLVALESAVTPAPARAVAAWLAGVAGEALATKAARVEEMERAGGRPSDGTMRTKLAKLGLGAFGDDELDEDDPTARPARARRERVEAALAVTDEVTGAAPGRVASAVQERPDAKADARLPKPGEVLAGKYALGPSVGRGGMGVVFEAEHLRMRQRVAIKFLHPHLLDDRDAVVRFEREARNASRLTSANAARIFDVDVTPTGVPFIVGELLEGQDLEHEIASRGALPVPEAIDYVLQACAAMTEAHDAGLVHRDLKPSNLFLVDRGGARTVKVLDFGISKVAFEGDVEITATDALLGSPRYMAPEQIEGARDVDRRADIWSLGMVLFHALAGRHPFEGAASTDVALAILSRPIPRLHDARPDLPRALCDVVMTALAKDPAARFATAAELARALEPFAVERTVPAVHVPAAGAPGSLPPSSASASGPSPLVQAREVAAVVATADHGVQLEEPSRSRHIVPLVVGAIALGAATLVGLALWQREAAQGRAAAAVSAEPAMSASPSEANAPGTGPSEAAAAAAAPATAPGGGAGAGATGPASSASGKHAAPRVRPSATAADPSGKPPKKKPPTKPPSGEQDPVFL